MQSKQPKKESEVEEHVLDMNIPQPELNGHAWMQRGTQLICQSCPFTHASFLPPSHQLYGMSDDGTPLIRRIQL